MQNDLRMKYELNNYKFRAGGRLLSYSPLELKVLGLMFGVTDDKIANQILVLTQHHEAIKSFFI